MCGVNAALLATNSGTVNVSGGSYTSNGYNSPAVYSTADITVKNATLTSLTNNGIINFNGYTITLADGTVLK